MKTVVASATHFKLDSRTIEPGSAPVPLAEVIFDMKLKLENLKVDFEAEQTEVNAKLERLMADREEQMKLRDAN